MTAFKLLVAYLSGSVSVLSEGIHSFLDLVSASVSFFTVREAVKPADHEHPFGHGKIETLSSLFEAILLVVAAALIVFEGVRHLVNPHPVHHQGLAIATILISLLLSYFVYRHNRGAAKETESTALHVNALHFLSDVVASAAILVGLVILHFTGWLIVDPILAFAVAAYVGGIALKQILHALHELSDIQLPEGEIQKIRHVLDSFRDRMIDAHDLRTRKGGATRHIDFHMVVCGRMTVDDSHGVCDEIETKILGEFPTASVNIHVEPCTQLRTSCDTHRCPLRKKA